MSLLSVKDRTDVIRSYAEAHECRMFVETGTAEGETLFALYDDFDLLVTIDISEHKYYPFIGNSFDKPNIRPYFGSSDRVLRELIPKCVEPAVFWLDAHWTPDEISNQKLDAWDITPILNEILQILWDGVPHVILVDDARLFGTEIGYPTMEDLESQLKFVAERHCDGFTYSMTVKDDIIRLVPVWSQGNRTGS